MRYQHATEERDRVLADALEGMAVVIPLNRDKTGTDGTDGEAAVTTSTAT